MKKHKLYTILEIQISIPVAIYTDFLSARRARVRYEVSH